MRISGIMNRMTKALIRKCLETEEPMKRVLIEPGRTYGFLDFIRIPVLVCPFFTLIKIINQAAAAITPSLQVLVTASFVDTALLIFAGNAERGEIRLPLLGLVLLITYNNLNWQLMSFVNLRSEMKLTRVYRSQVVEKRARLEYRCVEDNETWDLINRTCTDPVGKIRGGFDSLTGAAGIVLRVG